MSAASEKQHTSAARLVLITWNTHSLAPTPTTEPDLVTSPLRADGLAPTTGLLAMLTNGPLMVAAAPTIPAGYTVKVWLRDPITKRWGLAWSFQKPSNEWASTHDFNGGDLYFQIAGSVGDAGSAWLVHVVEL